MFGNGSSIILLAQKALPVTAAEVATAMQNRIKKKITIEIGMKVFNLQHNLLGMRSTSMVTLVPLRRMHGRRASASGQGVI